VPRRIQNPVGFTAPCGFESHLRYSLPTSSSNADKPSPGYLKKSDPANLAFSEPVSELSVACDFADRVQNEFDTHLVALLQDSFGPRSCTSPAVSRL